MTEDVILERRVHDLLDDRLITAFWDAAQHFGTKDLVLYFDEADDVDCVSAAPRLRELAHPGIPQALQHKLAKPAIEAATQLAHAEAAFWFVVSFDDGEMATVAVNAKPVAPGAHA